MNRDARFECIDTEKGLGIEEAAEYLPIRSNLEGVGEIEDSIKESTRR